MALTKKFLKTKPVCKVTFSYEAPELEEVALVGDFNDWNAEATPLKKLKNGTFKVVVERHTSNTRFISNLIVFNYLNVPGLA